MEARGGIEPPVQVLQTRALPLCYRAAESRFTTHLEGKIFVIILYFLKIPKEVPTAFDALMSW